uniref:Uncharacterized protein n=1 Tax=Percolomonas cosmopolitus TaxID=63605 RepID=A0A7S1KV28_9EUKA
MPTNSSSVPSYSNPYYSAPSQAAQQNAPPPSYHSGSGENVPLVGSIHYAGESGASSGHSGAQQQQKHSCFGKCAKFAFSIPILMMLIAAFTMSVISLTKYASVSGTVDSLYFRQFEQCVDCDPNQMDSSALTNVMGVSHGALGQLFRGFGVAKTPTVATAGVPSNFPTQTDQESAVLPFSIDKFAYAVVNQNGASDSLDVTLYQYESMAYYTALPSLSLPCSGMKIVKAAPLNMNSKGQRNLAFILKCSFTYYYAQVFADSSSRPKYSVISGVSSSAPQSVSLIAMSDLRASFAFTSQLNTYQNDVVFGVCGAQGDWWNGCTVASQISNKITCANPVTLLRGADASSDDYNTDGSRLGSSGIVVGVVCRSEVRLFAFLNTQNIEELPAIRSLPFNTAQTSRFHPLQYVPNGNSSFLFSYVAFDGTLKARFVPSLDVFSDNYGPTDVVIDSIDGSTSSPIVYDYAFYETERASFFVYTKNGERVIRILSFSEYGQPSYSQAAAGFVVQQTTLDTSKFTNLPNTHLLVSEKQVYMFHHDMVVKLVTYAKFPIYGAPNMLGIATKPRQWRIHEMYTAYFSGVLNNQDAFTQGQRFKVRQNGDVVPLSTPAQVGMEEYYVGFAVSKDDLLVQISFNQQDQ